MKGALLGGSKKEVSLFDLGETGAAAAAAAPPDFEYNEAAESSAVAASGRGVGASETSVEIRDTITSSAADATKQPVSIRECDNFRRHAKKQGHCASRASLIMSSSHGRLEGDQQEAGGIGTSTGNGRIGSGKIPKTLSRFSSDGSGTIGGENYEPPKHAKKQGHNTRFSVATVFAANGIQQSGHTRSGYDSNDNAPMDDTGHGSTRAGPYGFACEEEDGGVLDEKERTIEEEEMYARENAEARPVMLWFWNGLSSVLVFTRYLISVDSVLSLVLSCGLTYFTWSVTKDDEDFDGTMSFVLLGFAVLMPLSVTVRITFARREKALENIASLQTHAQHIYLCHACWNWGTAPGGGRSADPDRWLKHSDEVLSVLVAIGDELTRFLTLPNSSFSRHRETIPGRREAAVTIGASYRIFGDVINRRTARLAMLVEELKLGGFSASEASRVRQYEKLLTQSVQKLRMLKMYRSPKALNALLNLTATLLPPFYAPGFAQIAHDSGSLGIGIAFAAITSLALSALYESVQVLEDPFVAFLTLDGIDVYEELAVLYYHQLVETRRELFPNAHMFSEEPEEKDTDALSEIVEQDDFEESSPSPPRALNRRAMMASQKSMKGSTRMMSTKNAKRNSSLMRRQSAYKLDLPPELNRGRRSSGAASVASGFRDSIMSKNSAC